MEKPRDADTDFYYRIFNADGGEVEQCGNGARCFVKFVRGRGLTDKSEIRVETLGGTIVPRLEADGEMHIRAGHYIGVAATPDGRVNTCLVQPHESGGDRWPPPAGLLQARLEADPILAPRYRRALAQSLSGAYRLPQQPEQ